MANDDARLRELAIRLRDPVGVVEPPNEGRAYKHFIRLREPHDAEVTKTLHALSKDDIALIESLTRERDALRLEIESMRSSDWHKDAERYRFLRSPLAGEYGIVQGEFWEEMSYKLCREEKMDGLVDGAMKLLRHHIDAALKRTGKL